MFSRDKSSCCSPDLQNLVARSRHSPTLLSCQRPTWLLVSLRRARASCRIWWEAERWRSASAEMRWELVCQSGTEYRCPGFTLSMAIALKKGRKILVLIHGHTAEMEMCPQLGKLFKRKTAAAVSSNLASHLTQTHASTHGGHTGQAAEPASVLGPAGKPSLPGSPWRMDLLVETKSRCQHHLPAGVD